MKRGLVLSEAGLSKLDVDNHIKHIIDEMVH